MRYPQLSAFFLYISHCTFCGTTYINIVCVFRTVFPPIVSDEIPGNSVRMHIIARRAVDNEFIDLCCVHRATVGTYNITISAGAKRRRGMARSSLDPSFMRAPHNARKQIVVLFLWLFNLISYGQTKPNAFNTKYYTFFTKADPTLFNGGGSHYICQDQKFSNLFPPPPT